MRTVILTVIVLAAVSHAAACVITTEEQAVVVAYLRGVARGRVVLANTTEAAKPDLYLINLQHAAHGSAISLEARQDFESKNGKSCRVTLPSRFKVPLIAPSENTLNDTLFEKHGRRAELVLVSRVGLNRGGTVAILHVSSYGATAGGGCLYVFERRGGRWIKMREVPTWAT